VVRQVQVVAILMIANGMLLTLMGLYNALGALLFGFLLMAPGAKPPSNSADETMIAVMAGLQSLLGLAVLLAAVLNIVAGIRCLRLRGRTLALVALFSNVAPLLTCWCAPLCLALMIYGLIVFFHADVAFAFAEVAAGAPAERFKYARRHPEDEDDFDDKPLPPRPTPRPSENVQIYPDEYHRRPPQ
jgi:hypothetical protein